ncbi:hypothetical protein [Massilia varians]|uniref:hypothetical protein n=1 Tax=Massilia varians TaxID=457921 RepID=UPI0025543978|nr:hypothetical protein [Massilia varians]MDK6080570.1 hypothetical protein [Massilia varians]
MDNKNILDNEEAMSILRSTAASLKAIGVHCLVSPLSLPQGMSVSLHVGATPEASTAADVASERGGEYAHGVDTSKQFTEMVGCALADQTTMPDYLAALERENG